MTDDNTTRLAYEAVRRIGGCGKVNETGSLICIQDEDHDAPCFVESSMHLPRPYAQEAGATPARPSQCSSEAPPQTDRHESFEPVNEMLHRLWSRAVGTHDYVKKDWQELERRIYALVPHQRPGPAMDHCQELHTLADVVRFEKLRAAARGLIDALPHPWTALAACEALADELGMSRAELVRPRRGAHGVKTCPRCDTQLVTDQDVPTLDAFVRRREEKARAEERAACTAIIDGYIGVLNGNPANLPPEEISRAVTELGCVADQIEKRGQGSNETSDGGESHKPSDDLTASAVGQGPGEGPSDGAAAPLNEAPAAADRAETPRSSNGTGGDTSLSPPVPAEARSDGARPQLPHVTVSHGEVEDEIVLEWWFGTDEKITVYAEPTTVLRKYGQEQADPPSPKIVVDWLREATVAHGPCRERAVPHSEERARREGGARVAELESALRAIDNLVVQAESPKDMYDDVRAAVARALGGAR